MITTTMNEGGRRWLRVLVASAVFLGLAVVFQVTAGVPSSFAQTPDVGRDTSISGSGPDDCWGGVLSADPLQCYALAEAERDGVLTMEGMYDDGEGKLYIYIDHHAAVGKSSTYAGLEEALEERGGEYANANPNTPTYDFERHVCGRNPVLGAALSAPPATWLACIVEHTFLSGDVMPYELPYDVIDLRTGGAEARFTWGGWGSWTQLWPADPGSYSGDGVGNRDSATRVFDVSDVDVENFPAFDCSEQRSLLGGSGTTCRAFHRQPAAGIAGWHSSGATLYAQVKADSD